MSALPFAHVTDLADLPQRLRGGAVAIGNFDGMHRGHQAVIDALVETARAEGYPAMALTFEPHPRTFFAPDKPLFRLTPSHVKAVIGESLGLSGMVSLKFDAGLAHLAPEDFVSEILVKGLGVRHVVVGHDFCFGAKRAGNAAFLEQAGDRHGFTVDVVPAYDDEGGAVLSSSRVRDCLALGRVPEAAALLGWHWFFEGIVEHGAKRGRTIGFPTANVSLPPETRLAEGVYAVLIAVDGVRHHGVASFGRRPTFDDGPPIFETFIFDFSQEIYGKTVSVWPVSWLRPELKFESIDRLIVQMNRDCEEAHAVLASVNPNTVLDRVVMFGTEAGLGEE